MPHVLYVRMKYILIGQKYINRNIVYQKPEILFQFSFDVRLRVLHMSCVLYKEWNTISVCTLNLA